MTEGFAYRDGALSSDGVALADIAKVVGTPAYVYSAGAMEDAYRRLKSAVGGLNATICYAMKANPSLAVVSTFAALGAGADVVSGGELAIALAAGVAPERIVFSGVGKTRDEMAQALAAGIGQFNVESEPELAVLSEVAQARGQRAPIAIRVNPDIAAGGHDKITTGRKIDKFGIDIARAPEIYARAAALPGVEIVGVAVHIGSQIVALDPFHAAFARAAALAAELAAAGHAVRRLDLGGGLGVAYEGARDADLADYARIVTEATRGFAGELVFEPGRFLVAAAGALLARVLYVKDTPAKRFVIVDAAMNDLIRPALYDARHPIVPVAEPAADGPLAEADVVGPVCESGDVLGLSRMLPPLSEGALVAVLMAGAYGAAMASEYNSRPLAPEVMVRDGRYAVTRSRPGIEERLKREALPPWLMETRKARSRGAA